MFLPEKNKSEELQLVAKNDEHHKSMSGDHEFMAQVKERNEEAKSEIVSEMAKLGIKREVVDTNPNPTDETPIEYIYDIENT